MNIYWNIFERSHETITSDKNNKKQPRIVTQVFKNSRIVEQIFQKNIQIQHRKNSVHRTQLYTE